MGKIKTTLPYLLVIALGFCFLSSLMKDYDSANIILAWVLPLFCLIISVVYGINNSFNVLYVIFVLIIVATVLFIRVPLKWDYTIIYGAATLIGNAIGMIFHKCNVRIKIIKKHGRRFSIIVAVAIVASYIVAVM